MLNYLLLTIFCATAVFAKRGIVMGLLIGSMILCPEYLRFELFLAQMSITRFIAIIVMIRWWKSSKLRINTYDNLVIGYWVLYLLMSIIAGADSKQLIYVIGRSMDTFLMYFAARVCLTSKDDVVSFSKTIGTVAAVAAILAIIESFTSHSLYISLRSANMWMWNDKEYEARVGGLVRAYGATLNPIYWGMTMFIGLVVQTSISQLFQRKLFTFNFILLCFGVFSSLSSGPIMSLLIFSTMVIAINSKKCFSISLALGAALALVVEVASNRHFYDMAQYLTLNSDTAWYRSKLIEVALANFSIYALFGVGGHWPHYWGASIDGREIVDVVNQYIAVALNGGVLLLATYLYLQIRPILFFYKSWNDASSVSNAQRVACFGLIAIALAGFTVAFYNPVENMLYILLGIIRQLQEFQSLDSFTKKVPPLSGIKNNGYGLIYAKE